MEIICMISSVWFYLQFLLILIFLIYSLSTPFIVCMIRPFIRLL